MCLRGTQVCLWGEEIVGFTSLHVRINLIVDRDDGLPAIIMETNIISLPAKYQNWIQ